MPFAPTWTPEEDTRLTGLWNQANPQVPTAEIGRLMGKTKNAVIGRAHRLNLPARPSPLTQTGNRALRTAQGRG